MSTNVATPRKIATTITANATLAKGTHTPVDATTGSITVALPTGATQGAHLSVEKTDNTTNTVTITGSVRGASSTLNLTLPRESLTFTADSTGSWWPTADHKTLSSLGYTSGYLLACFRAASGSLGGDQKLSILYSPDGKTFQDDAYRPSYRGSSPNYAVRDPSIIFRNGRFYVAYTNSGVTGSSFDIVSSADLVNWSLVATVPMTGLTPTYTWAPEFFEDGSDLYIFVSVDFNPYWLKATNTALTTWTNPQALTISGRPSAVIDPTFVKHTDGNYYCFYKREDNTVAANRLIYRAVCATPTGTYVTDKTGDWAGWGSDIEGPSIVRRNEGGYRIYLDAPNDTTNLSSFYYSDSTDLNTWTALAPVGRTPGVPYKLRHGTVLPLDRKVAAPATAPWAGRYRRLTKRLTTDTTFTAASYTNYADLSVTFVPSSWQVAVRVNGIMSPGGSNTDVYFRVVAVSANGGTQNANMGAFEGSAGARTPVPGLTGVVSNLLAGESVTLTLQAYVTNSQTVYCRPNTIPTEQLTMTVEDTNV